MTCGPYDRARALIDGEVKPEGIDLEIYVNASPGRQTKIHGKEFDAAEFYTATYIADLHYKTLGYTAIPIFVKRMFRHSYIYMNLSLIHISEPTRQAEISYAVFCLKKK